MTERILCVDDEAHVLSGLRRTLRGRFELVLAEGAKHALEVLAEEGPFAVVLADMRMPGMDGAQLLSKVRDEYPETVRMMLTGNADLLTAIRAVNEGNIFRFLNKPCGTEDLARALEAGIEQHKLICAEKEVLEQTLNGCIKVLTEILSLTDPESFGNSDELKGLAGDVARKLELPRPWEVEMATMLAQLGRLTVPADVLKRADHGGKLNAAECKMLKSIPSIGGSLIEEIPRLKGVAELVKQQAEDWKSEMEAAPAVGARIIRTLQDMQSMGESGISRQQALTFMDRESKVHDSDVVAAVAECVGVGLVESEPVTRQITFAALRPGHVLAASLITSDGRMMLREGKRIGQVLLERLRNHHQISGFREPLYIETKSPAGPSKGRSG